MFLGYMRVSKNDGTQSLDLQRDALGAAGVGPGALYEDMASGKRDDRPGLLACLKALRAGDVLVVWKLDRLGRDIKHLITIVEDLHARGVGLKVLTGQGAAVDTTSATGKLTFRLFAALAEYERDTLIERTRAGLAAARARGRLGGRPRKVTRAKLRQAQVLIADKQSTAREVAEMVGVNRTVLYRYVNGDGSLKPLGQALLYGQDQAAHAAD